QATLRRRLDPAPVTYRVAGRTAGGDHATGVEEIERAGRKPSGLQQAGVASANETATVVLVGPGRRPNAEGSQTEQGRVHPLAGFALPAGRRAFLVQSTAIAGPPASSTNLPDRGRTSPPRRFQRFRGGCR